MTVCASCCAQQDLVGSVALFSVYSFHILVELQDF